MTKIFKKLTQGKIKFISIPVIIIISLILFPIVIGVGLFWLVYKKVKNIKVRNFILIVVSIFTLFFGGTWIYALSSPEIAKNKSEKTTETVLTPIIEEQKIELTPTTTQELSPTPTVTTNSDETKQQAMVVKIIDGDTIDVSINGKTERIRFIGVDTPETVDPRKSVQCFGKEASAKTKELLNGKNVILESDSTQGDKDKYSRLLRYIYLEDGTFINQKLIEDGYGFEYTYNIPYKYQKEFKEAQKQADLNKRGLWADNSCTILTPIPTIKPTSKPLPTKVPVVQPTTTQIKTENIVPIINNSNGSWECNCSKTCPNMSSCAEAQYQLNVCGCSARDGDDDGTACDTDCQ